MLTLRRSLCVRVCPRVRWLCRKTNIYPDFGDTTIVASVSLCSSVCRSTPLRNTPCTKCVCSRRRWDPGPRVSGTVTVVAWTRVSISEEFSCPYPRHTRRTETSTTARWPPISRDGRKYLSKVRRFGFTGFYFFFLLIFIIITALTKPLLSVALKSFCEQVR